jgi:hypothetical protein
VYVGEAAMRHWDGGRLQVYVLVHLPMLAEQAGTCEGCHLFSQERPQKRAATSRLVALTPG